MHQTCIESQPLDGQESPSFRLLSFTGLTLHKPVPLPTLTWCLQPGGPEAVLLGRAHQDENPDSTLGPIATVSPGTLSLEAVGFRSRGGGEAGSCEPRNTRLESLSPRLMGV